MNESGPSGNITSFKPLSGFAKFFFVAWIAAVLIVYFLAFGTRYVESLFRRLGLDSIGGWLQRISDALMTWFSASGG
ncbi:MAG: hypothetical protein QGH60_05140 [Phycisphaerae bacterium]|jgi:hypothetical protein|nr:hypothetical protein [Phycisphaerae bacterium]